MSINFPNNPNTNDTYVFANITWRWNGSAWDRISTAAGTLGASGPRGATGATGAIPTNYVISVNGVTGAITNVAKTNEGNTFSVLQVMLAGLTSNGASFSNPIYIQGLAISKYRDISGGDVLSIGGGTLSRDSIAINGLNASGQTPLSTAFNIAINGLNGLTTGSNNVGIGGGFYYRGNSNVSVGIDSGRGVCGDSNVSIGHNANGAAGEYGVTANSDSSNNIAVGTNSFVRMHNLSGLSGYNISIGDGPGFTTAHPYYGSSNRGIFIGFGLTASQNSSNQIMIGNNLVSRGNNTTVIGNTSTTETYLYGLVNAPSGVSAANIVVESSLVIGTGNTGAYIQFADGTKKYSAIIDGGVF